MLRMEVSELIGVCEGENVDRRRTVLAFDRGDVADLLDVQKRSNTGHEGLAKGRVSSEDMRVAALLDVLYKQRCIVLRKSLVVRSVLDVDDLLDALNLGHLLRYRLDVRPGQDTRDSTTDFGTSRDCRKR